MTPADTPRTNGLPTWATHATTALNILTFAASAVAYTFATIAAAGFEGTEVNYDGPLWVTDRVSPSDLTGVSIQFSKAFEHVEPDEGWVVVDSLGVLSMYVSGERAMTQFRGLADEELNFASRR